MMKFHSIRTVLACDKIFDGFGKLCHDISLHFQPLFIFISYNFILKFIYEILKTWVIDQFHIAKLSYIENINISSLLF